MTLSFLVTLQYFSGYFSHLWSWCVCRPPLPKVISFLDSSPISMILPFSLSLSCDMKANFSLAHSVSQHYAPISPGSHVLGHSPCFVIGIPKRAMCLSPSARYLSAPARIFVYVSLIVLRMHSLVEICPYVLSVSYHAICTRCASSYYYRLLFILYITIYHVSNDMPICQLTIM